jgi:4-amino-4-deoxy-L-arabinose transferase-like glycosyltransferase
MRNRTTLYLLLILAGSFWLRSVNLADNPSGFFRDEADKGYTTYSLLHTGKDQIGKTYPLFVRSLNVTTSALYQYLDIPFVAVLGLNEQAVRLPASLAGTVSVLAAFFLARAMWGSGMGLLAALFVALSPWSLLLSRWANQAILLTALIPLALYFFIKSLQPGPRALAHTFFSSLFFLLAFYTYAPARLFVPVFMLLLWCVSFSSSDWNGQRALWGKRLALFWFLFAIGSIPMAHHLLAQSSLSSARLASITINDGQPFWAMTKEYLNNYFLHLSPAFLFLHGDANLRHHPASLGQVHLYLFPLLLGGLWRAFRKRERLDRILLVWFFCFPLSAAYTRESIPHALRSVFAIPAIQVMAVYGLYELSDWGQRVKNKLSPQFIPALRYLWIAAVVICSLSFLTHLFFKYPAYSAMHWEYGYRDAVHWWMENRQENDRTVISGIAEYPYIFFLFYGKFPPERWIADPSIDGLTFVPLGQDISPYYRKSGQRSLYLVRPFELPGIQPAKAIVLPQGEAAWKWVILNAQD